MTEIEIRTAILRERLRTHPPSEDNLDLYADLVKLERLITETNRAAGRGPVVRRGLRQCLVARPP